MTATEPVLTLKLIEEIGKRIRGGAFEQIAVETMGVPFAAYQTWLQLGEQADGPELCRMLASEVRQAIGWARLKPEMELHENDAKTWLLYGPGKESALREGWGHGAKPAGEETERDDWLEVCALLVEALAPFPEARMAAAEVLARRSESNSQRDVDNERGQP